jgi:hypothetical protein
MNRIRIASKSTVLVAAVVMLGGAFAASASATKFATVAKSTFAAADDGWTVQGAAVGPTFHAKGGKGGGYISANDPAGTSSTSFWIAPAKYLGNLGASLKGTLTFDMRDVGPGDTYTDPDVILKSGSLVLDYRQSKRPKGKAWLHIAVKLDGKKGWVDRSTGLQATPQQMQTALGSLDTLLVRGEYRNGPEVFDLDNVVLKIPAK